MSGRIERRCVFIPDRGCHVDADEIPLEICQLCLETWKAMSGRVTVRRSLDRLRAAEVQPVQTVEERPVQAEQRPVKGEEAVQPPAAQPERVDMAEALAELDRLFEEGEIELEEYVRRRKSIVDSARKKRNSLFNGFERILRRTEPRYVGLVLVEKEMFGVKVKAAAPEGWRQPESLDGEALRAIYNFYASLKEQAGDIRLEHRDFKVASLGFKDGKLALLISDRNREFSEFDEYVKKFSSRLKRELDWEKNLPRLYRELFQETAPRARFQSLF